MTSGLSLGNFAIVASLTFRCWATIAGGVRAIQSDKETSAKYGALKTLKELQVGVACVLDISVRGSS